MLFLRKTTQGVNKGWTGVNRSQPGSLLATKNHEGGLANGEDETDAKLFSVPGSERCPVKTLKNYSGHLNPTSDVLFQRPSDGQSKKFNPADEKIWFCSAPLGTTTLDNMLKEMSKRAGISPHLTNHCLRATICHSALRPNRVQFSINLLRFWFFIQLFARRCTYHVFMTSGRFGARKSHYFPVVSYAEGWEFNKTIIPFVLLGYEIGYSRLISNARSWNNC